MADNSIENKVIQKIRKCGRGKLFFASDFVGYGENKSVIKALERLAKSGAILRISRGADRHKTFTSQTGGRKRFMGVGNTSDAFHVTLR